MKLKVLVVCGCKLPKETEDIYRDQQSILISLFTHYPHIIDENEDLEFLTINVFKEDYVYWINKFGDTFKGTECIDLKCYFDYIIYEHCPFSFIPEEHKIYSDMLKVGGLAIFYVKRDFDKVINYFLSKKEITNYMFHRGQSYIYQSNSYKKICGICYKKVL